MDYWSWSNINQTVPEWKQIIQLKEEIKKLKKALQLAIKCEPIECNKICGHDNDYTCQNKDSMECINKHIEYLIQLAEKEIADGE